MQPGKIHLDELPKVVRMLDKGSIEEKCYALRVLCPCRNPIYNHEVWQKIFRAKQNSRSVGHDADHAIDTFRQHIRHRKGQAWELWAASLLQAIKQGVPSSSPEDIAAWINQLLKLESYHGVGKSHPGVDRISRWMINRLTNTGDGKISIEEFLQKARQWLPEFFERAGKAPENPELPRKLKKRHRNHGQINSVEVEVEADFHSEEVDKQEEEVLNCLASENPKQRSRGLKLLLKMEVPDLFDWCVAFLEDESKEVQVVALQTMFHCDQVNKVEAKAVKVVIPFAASEDKRLRAAAIAVLAKHSDEDTVQWFERGLKDNEACVRLETAALLSELDPTKHRDLFELALYDPNPQVKHMARKLTVGKGYGMLW